jgi:Putative glycerate kinase
MFMNGGDPGTVSIQNRDSLARSQAREVALDCVRAGIEAAHPRRVVPETVSLDGGTLQVRGTGSEGFTQTLDGFDEVILVGGGKAAVAVAVELESLLRDMLDAGVVVAKSTGDTDKVDVIEAGHPIPDAAGTAGAERIKRVVTDANSDTLVIGVITGGASSLLPLPVEGVELNDMRAVTRDLLEAGVPIEGLNTVRKHLSALKGGRLAEAAAPATVGVVALSDVVAMIWE